MIDAAVICVSYFLAWVYKFVILRDPPGLGFVLYMVALAGIVPLYLMLYPYAAIEYVALHEVCHIAHMDHSKAFYNMIEKYMPDYRQREKLLRPESIMSAQETLEIYINI